MRRVVSLFLLFNSIAATLVLGQEDNTQDILDALADDALQINIVARVLPLNTETDLNTVSSKLTIPGRPVVVRIEGENILINAILTPYVSEKGKLILVAQGQIWFSEAKAERPVRYLSSLKSIPVSLGEKIFFFPLGVAEDFKNFEDFSQSNSFNIALEIEIVPYKNK